MQIDQQVDIGGYRIRCQVNGEGTPTVILVAGLGNTLEIWDKVSPKVAEFSQVLSYDRPGIGGSEKGPHAQTSNQIAIELHTLLAQVKIAPPYILVGHSAGGLYIRVFASMYPDTVVGMVFVDSCHEQQWYRWQDVMAEVVGQKQASQEWKSFFTHPLPAKKDEVFYFKETLRNGDPLHAENALPDVLVKVLTSTKPKPHSRHESEIQQKLLQTRIAWQKELADLVTDGEQLLTPNSGHWIQLDEPELVIQSIHQIYTLKSSNK